MSWNEAWSGTEQVRFGKLVGNTLTFTTAPADNPLDGQKAVHEVIFEKATNPDG